MTCAKCEPHRSKAIDWSAERLKQAYQELEWAIAHLDHAPQRAELNAASTAEGAIHNGV